VGIAGAARAVIRFARSVPGRVAFFVHRTGIEDPRARDGKGAGPGTRRASTLSGPSGTAGRTA
jgi:hypothetical protein